MKMNYADINAIECPEFLKQLNKLKELLESIGFNNTSVMFSCGILDEFFKMIYLIGKLPKNQTIQKIFMKLGYDPCSFYKTSDEGLWETLMSVTEEFDVHWAFYIPSTIIKECLIILIESVNESSSKFDEVDMHSCKQIIKRMIKEVN